VSQTPGGHSQPCPRLGCGHINLPEARFCARCGQRLWTNPPQADAAPRTVERGGGGLGGMLLACTLIGVGTFLLFGGMPILGLGLFGVTLILTGGSRGGRRRDNDAT